MELKSCIDATWVVITGARVGKVWFWKGVKCTGPQERFHVEAKGAKSETERLAALLSLLTRSLNTQPEAHSHHRPAMFLSSMPYMLTLV